MAEQRTPLPTPGADESPIVKESTSNQVLVDKPSSPPGPSCGKDNHGGIIEAEDKDDASDSGASTEPISESVLEKLRYSSDFDKVEASDVILDVGEPLLQAGDLVHHICYKSGECLGEAYLPEGWLPDNARYRLREQNKPRKRKRGQQAEDHSQKRQRNERLRLLHSYRCKG
ncbi:hypothetical protein AJ80_08815 [Polytolypa hystricis UAMH7299]|uniref:Uncharacterized protein n=1 Tax=Polytolypa hystricis (strain UAMH7299) TaxID=1447883 RepID=A0A2B7X1F3_POLH7|nr:hypothetical protein AJ80_08815 [Polytolypa hystricis UAMH7299]